MGYWEERDAKRQAERDYDRGRHSDYQMYDRYGRDDQRAYAEEYDRCQREDERRQEERREEERAEELRDNRRQQEMEHERQREEAAYWEQMEAQEQPDLETLAEDDEG